MSTGGLADLLARRAGAAVTYRGAQVAVSYGSAADEYGALDAGAALVDFSFLTDITATGDERAEFLQGQVSQDVSRLAPGTGAPALALTAQGRVQALVALYAHEESIDVVVDASGRDLARARLEQFLVADDVEFEDGPEPAARIGLVGAAAVETLAAVTTTSSLAAPGGDAGAEAWWSARGEVAGEPCLVHGRGDLRVPSVEIVVAAAGDAVAVWKALEERGAVAAGASAFEILRVESGLPLVGIDVDDGRIAVEARLEWAIHFDKGCYVGQEIVERAVSRGRLNRELCLLGAAEPLAPGSRVEGGGERDVVTSTARSPKLGFIGLAYVPLDACPAGTEVCLENDGGTVVAHVLDWPRARHHEGR